jgi:hypothetical protein
VNSIFEGWVIGHVTGGLLGIIVAAMATDFVAVCWDAACDTPVPIVVTQAVSINVQTQIGNQ